MPHTTKQITEAITASGILNTLTVTVRVSPRRRTLGITTKPGGHTLTIHVPTNTTPAEVVQTLESISDRIARLIHRARENTPEHPTLELVSGAQVMWLGRSARLAIRDGNAPVERVHGPGHWLHAGRDLLAREGARPIIRWYQEQGTAWLHQQAPALWHRMAPPGTPLPELRVDDIGRTRWGKYQPDRHRVTIAWQALQLRPTLATYVVVHELAHATHPSGRPHGPQFWSAAARGCPLAREVHQTLSQEGRTVWMGDTATSPHQRQQTA